MVFAEIVIERSRKSQQEEVPPFLEPALSLEDAEPCLLTLASCELTLYMVCPVATVYGVGFSTNRRVQVGTNWKRILSFGNYVFCARITHFLGCAIVTGEFSGSTRERYVIWLGVAAGIVVRGFLGVSDSGSGAPLSSSGNVHCLANTNIVISQQRESALTRRSPRNICSSNSHRVAMRVVKSLTAHEFSIIPAPVIGRLSSFQILIAKRK
jgi:hypothetical protein